MTTMYEDRADAGRRLGEAVAGAGFGPDAVVLGMARGGVPVATGVARAIGAPLDVVVVRKLGVPGHEELAFGSVAHGGALTLNRDVVAAARLSDAEVEEVAERERIELRRQEERFRGARAPEPLAGRVAVVVDDGIATGASVRAAVEAVASSDPSRTVIAVPVAAPQSVAELRSVVDEVVCPLAPEGFRAVGLWYRRFPQVSDAEVAALLTDSPGFRAAD